MGPYPPRLELKKNDTMIAKLGLPLGSRHVVVSRRGCWLSREHEEEGNLVGRRRSSVYFVVIYV